ncbi:MAG: hypothetical protein AAF430_19620 [Myxococcota bacterium]
MSWERLGAIAPNQLTGAREQAHAAVQLLAAVGETHAEHRADTSHTATVYRPDLRALAIAAPLAGGLQAVLDLAELRVDVLGPAGTVGERTLDGRTLAEAAEWLRDTLAAGSDGQLAGALRFPTYDLEPHPVREGTPFEAPRDGLAELDRWFANARLALADYAPDEAILCWPHHFDLAILQSVAPLPEGGTKTVGIGLSPGDGAIPEPYWYVNHWPVRGVGDLSFGSLPAGSWHTDGFIAATLRASELVEAPSADSQSSTLHAFLEAAIRHSKEFLR